MAITAAQAAIGSASRAVSTARASARAAREGTMIQIRPAKERGHANHGWLDTHYTFSFSDYYDPRFMGFRRTKTCIAYPATRGWRGHVLWQVEFESLSPPERREQKLEPWIRRGWQNQSLLARPGWP